MGPVDVNAREAGIRGLRARLSACVQQVRAGATPRAAERGKTAARAALVSRPAETRVQGPVQAGSIAGSGRKPAPSAPIVRARGRRTVADLLLEDREGWI
jgi:antitoxin (DNA-binding transcriptional repressor) of toxin-antitoxin stability system